MTIQELIEGLRKYPLETEVLVHAGGVHFAPIQIAAGEVRVAADREGHPIYHDFRNDGLSKRVLAILANP